VADVYTKAKRSEIMSRIKSSGTKPEEKIADLLKQAGLKFRRYVKLPQGNVDFIIQSTKIIVLVHGCFWHGHTCSRAALPTSNLLFWKDKISRNKRRDARLIRQLRNDGWHIITIWQCSLSKPNRILSRLGRI
jgi:DNA mismatch endonuclease (patch repair protein)